MKPIRMLFCSFRKLTSLAFFLLFIYFIFLPPSLHAQNTNLVNISLNPATLNQHMKINDTVTVGVDLDPGQSYKITGVDIKINYNPEIFELTNSIPGNYIPIPTALQCPNCQPKIANGSYTAVFLTGTGANPQTAPGRLLQLKFKAIKAGQAAVSVDTGVTNISGYDAQNNPVENNLLGTATDANYTVDADTPTVPPNATPTKKPITPTVPPNATPTKKPKISATPAVTIAQCGEFCLQANIKCADGYVCKNSSPTGQVGGAICVKPECADPNNTDDPQCQCGSPPVCSQAGGPCGTGFAGNSLGTCCSGLTCIESTIPDVGGTCQNGPIPCYRLPACVNDNPPCDINIPAGAVLCPITPPSPPTCPTHPFGDANCDGVINDADYRIWEYEMQFPKLPNKRADFNTDGREDMVDFEIFRRNSRGPVPSIYPCIENMLPYCPDGKYTGGGIDANGCQLPPYCATSNCCSPELVNQGHQCLPNCNSPVANTGNSAPGYSCFQPSEVISREKFGCPLVSNSNTQQDNQSSGSGDSAENDTESDIDDTNDVINEDGDNVSQGSHEIWLGTGESTDKSYAGFHFKHVKIPRGAKIINASLEFKNSKKQKIALNIDIGAEDVANAKPFSKKDPPSKRKIAKTRSKHLSDEEWKANSKVSINDLKPVIQAIINKPDWKSGNSLNLILKGKGSSWGRKFVALTSAPKLIIKYR